MLTLYSNQKNYLKPSLINPIVVSFQGFKFSAGKFTAVNFDILCKNLSAVTI